MLRFDFSGQTVLIAGAGCAAGTSLAALFAEAGAQVIAIDRDEAAVLEVAAQAPHRIEPLRLDVMRDDHCRHLGRIWADEPIAVLLHLQPLRDPDRPGRVLNSIVTLSRVVQPGLEAGKARLFYLFQPDAGDVVADAVAAAYHRLAPAMQDRMGDGTVAVNAMQLPEGADDSVWRSVFDAVAGMTGPAGLAVGGAILPLLPRPH